MSDNIKRHPDPALVDVRRKQVLDAAARCFRRHGYHGASMAEIACAASMSPGHIYHYFESKRAIIEAIIEKDVEELFSTMRDLQNQPGELLDAIIDGLHTSVDQSLDTDRGALLLEMFAEAARNPQVAALLRSADALTRQGVRALLAGPRGTLSQCDTDELDCRIEVVNAIFSGLLIRALMNPSLKREGVIAALRPVLRTALTPSS
jgi:TetR/AcrR family transcriptional regulator, repressor for uid operon